MQTQSQSKARTRVLATLGVALLIVSATVLLRAAFDGPSSAAALPGASRAGALPRTNAELSAPVASDDSLRSAAGRASGDAPIASEPTAATPDVSRPVELDEVWKLVEQLEALARAPATFHANAMPVIELLTAACERRAREAADLESNSAPGSSPPTTVWDELLARVVRSGERNELVRGAVALSIARDLPEADFWRLFDEWLALPREGSLELVRAAALGAALRGDEGPCHRELGLSRLGALPGSEAERPGIYPLSLRRVALPAAGAALRRWLDLPDPRRSLFRGPAQSIADARELASALDFFVAAEVLYCVWGHGAIVDSSVERELVRTALCETGDSSAPDLLTLRAAHFVLRSLAECNAALADGAYRASSSSLPIVAGLAKSMEALGVGGLGLKLMAEIERLRYASSADDEPDLLLLLVQANEALAVLGRARTAGRENAIEYLLTLAEDVNVTEMGRGGAMMAVTDNATWAELLAVVRRALTSGVAGMQNYTAVRSLVEAAGDDASRKLQALQLLEGLASPSLDPDVLEMIHHALSQLRS